MTGSVGEEAQLSLPGIARAEARRAKPPAAKPPVVPADVDPVARILVDLPLAHLDRPFDYLVPATMAATAVVGARVKVRFAGQDVDGFVLDRVGASDHPGTLQALRRVVSAEPVLSAEVADLVAEVAARYAGTRSDVLRLAVPARHAATEKAPVAEPSPWRPSMPAVDSWSAYDGAEAGLTALASGVSPRLVWTVAPGDDPTALLADAVQATAAAGRGALVCLPDRRDVERLDAALRARLGEGQHVVLTADAGPARRYAAFLAVSRGHVRIVIGTRAAAFAPVRDLGLVALWDDGDDLFAEPRAPYPHAREVLLLRAQALGCAVLLAAHARSVEAAYLVTSGWATQIAPARDEVRRRIRVGVSGDSDAARARDWAPGARLPKEAYDLLRSGLERGPVLVQTPRAGYATRLSCDRCRTPALCSACQGPLRVRAAGAPPSCGWCATPAPAWHCATCGGRGLRAPVLGDGRTAEELGRAFPSVPVRRSAAGQIAATVPDRPAIVVATPGAEPVAECGYAAVLLLDTWLLLARSDLRAAEEAVRRWTNAAALIAGPGPQAGPVPVLLVGDPAHPALQALVRWDAAGFALREIADRQSAHLPPASRVAVLDADPDLLEQAVSALVLPPGAEVLGPVLRDPTAGTEPGNEQRIVVRVPRAAGAALSAALVAMQAQRSARKEAHVRVEVDPLALG
jgi:primosomal protein N' (replication factor Y)